jgi:hypothetical protein
VRRTFLPGVTLITPFLVFGLAAAASPAAGHASAAGRHHSAGTATAARVARPASGLAAAVPFCQKLARNELWASSGARMYCFGPQRTGPARARSAAAGRGLAAAPRNVDAASLAEDISPAGMRAEGQSETSVAAAGPYAVEAWNDSTGFLSPCPSPMSKEELTGFGFSADGGKTFTDLGGLPNGDCKKYAYYGDPSVAAYVAGGATYFYISSLYLPQPVPFGLGPTKVAMAACKVTGSGGAASLSCGQPVIEAASTQCRTVQVAPGKTGQLCSFLDKPYITVDPAHGRLYLAYTEFLLRGTASGQEELAACDLGSPLGGTGPAGGTPAAPVCEHGSKLVPAGTNFRAGKPYFTVAKQDPNGCENQGSYPAADPVTGNVFVAYEYNLATSLGGFVPCEGASTPVSEVLTKVPARCLALAAVSPCSAPAAVARVPIVSLEGTFVPGYNRGTTNDFPRLAVSDRYHTVSMVWNDARHHLYGDILLQSFTSGSLRPVQAAPVVLDQPHHGGLAMLPALRMATGAGRLDVSWYSRPNVNTADTSLVAATGVSPLASTTPRNVPITTVASNWTYDSSGIVPNFGDYTDNTVSVTGSWPYAGNTLYVAWSDGRLGIPQPFLASLPAG